jgi:hypothetical protein
VKQYPDIYIPQKLAQIPESYPPPPPKPVSPKKPTHPKSPGWKLAAGVGFVSALLFVLLFQGNLIVALIGGVLLAGITRLMEGSLYKSNVSAFREESAKYRRRLQQYEKDQADYIQKIELLRQPESVKNYRNQLFQTFVEGIYKPDGTDSSAPTGQSEFILVDAMRKHLAAGNVVERSWLKIPNYEYPYSPDICYIYKDLYMDVEVDEPYYFKNGQYYPYHGYDQWKDSNRNNFFTNRHWIVIRFSEEQVVKYPDSCVKEICKVIKQITGDSLPCSLANVNDLEPIPRWTTEEARTMIDERYRDSY